MFGCVVLTRLRFSTRIVVELALFILYSLIAFHQMICTCLQIRVNQIINNKQNSMEEEVEVKVGVKIMNIKMDQVQAQVDAKDSGYS